VSGHCSSHVRVRRPAHALLVAFSLVSGGAAGLLVPSVAMVGIAAAAEPRVTIVDFAFQPTTITITAGQTVTWQNIGSAQHTVTADDGSFYSGPLDPGNQFANRFDKPGTYTYHCSIHTQMKGTVIVKAAAPTATPKGSPTPTPPSGSFPPGFSLHPIQTHPPASPSAVGQSSSDHGPPVGLVVVVLLAVLAAAAVTALHLLRQARPGP
jgi:plastocyanin